MPVYEYQGQPQIAEYEFAASDSSRNLPADTHHAQLTPTLSRITEEL